jgi:hypothetical protein
MLSSAKTPPPFVQEQLCGSANFASTILHGSHEVLKYYLGFLVNLLGSTGEMLVKILFGLKERESLLIVH